MTDKPLTQEEIDAFARLGFDWALNNLYPGIKDRLEAAARASVDHGELDDDAVYGSDAYADAVSRLKREGKPPEYQPWRPSWADDVPGGEPTDPLWKSMAFPGTNSPLYAEAIDRVREELMKAHAEIVESDGGECDLMRMVREVCAAHAKLEKERDLAIEANAQIFPLHDQIAKLEKERDALDKQRLWEMERGNTFRAKLDDLEEEQDQLRNKEIAERHRAERAEAQIESLTSDGDEQIVGLRKENARLKRDVPHLEEKVRQLFNVAEERDGLRDEVEGLKGSVADWREVYDTDVKALRTELDLEKKAHMSLACLYHETDEENEGLRRDNLKLRRALEYGRIGVLEKEIVGLREALEKIANRNPFEAGAIARAALQPKGG